MSEANYVVHTVYDERWYTDADEASVYFCGSLRECREMVRDFFPSGVIVNNETNDIVPSKAPRKDGTE